jgi:hypothetical protein
LPRLEPSVGRQQLGEIERSRRVRWAQPGRQVQQRRRRIVEGPPERGQCRQVLCARVEQKRPQRLLVSLLDLLVKMLGIQDAPE